MVKKIERADKRNLLREFKQLHIHFSYHQHTYVEIFQMKQSKFISISVLFQIWRQWQKALTY